jgi:hypothetical protein
MKKTKVPKIGSTVNYKGKEFKVLGYAARVDENQNKWIEIAWNNYNVSPSGYLAVPLRLLK